MSNNNNKRRPRNRKPAAVLDRPQETRRSPKIRPGGTNFTPIDDKIMGQMYTSMSAQPVEGSTTMYAPGAPIRPIPGITPNSGPRQFSYDVGYNISQLPRGTEEYSFADLRALATLFDAVQICEQVWFDYVSKLELVIEPLPELVDEDGDISMYAPDISKYLEFFEFPDKERDLHSWLRMAVREQLEIDALAIYVRKDKAGRPYSLDILDGSTLKPLLDDRGRRPTPPFPAYEQFVYGVPAALLTSDDLLYVKESEQSDSVYGRSRIERAILRINQALRKQSRDLARFTDGTVPAGFIQPDMDVTWTQEELAAFELMLNNLMAGNDQLRARAKVLPKGFKFVSTDEAEIKSEFDLFIITIIAACFGLTLDELAITLTSNRAVGQSQENVLYRRAIQPLMMRYARLLTHILRKYFNESRFVVKWKGFDEAEDFGAKATAFATLVNAGIQSPTQAAHEMKLPVYNDMQIGPYVQTKSGIQFLEDASNPDLRKAQVQSQLAGYQFAASNPGGPPQPASDGSDGEDDTEEQDTKDTAKTAPSGAQSTAKKGKAPQDDEAPSKADVKRLMEQVEELLSIERAKRADVVKQPQPAPVNTGMMLAFLLDEATATQLAIPGGEPVSDMHITLCYMGKASDFTGSLDHLKTTVASFAASQTPLQGKVSGIGRFTPSEHSDGLAPVYASVDVAGLHTFRERLVQTVEAEDFQVVHSFGSYVPHITLAFVDENAPNPVTSIPAVPLTFIALSLAVGDEQFLYPLSATQNTVSEEERNTHAEQTTHQSMHTSSNTQPAITDAHTSDSASRETKEDYKRWRSRAIEDVKAGKSQRPFASNAIPPQTHTAISRSLAYCTTPDEVNAIFRVAKEQSPYVWEPPDTDARLAMLHSKGVATQTWNSHAGACAVCLGNDGKTVPLYGTFPGLQRIVYCHPHCECIPVYRDAEGNVVKIKQEVPV